jgi:hypothetical protein
MGVEDLKPREEKEEQADGPNPMCYPSGKMLPVDYL